MWTLNPSFIPYIIRTLGGTEEFDIGKIPFKSTERSMTNPRKRISIDEKKKELEERYLESSVDHENKTEIDKKYRSSKMHMVVQIYY